MQNQKNLHERLEATLKNFTLLLEPIKELIRGFKANTIPWDIAAGWMTGSLLILFFKIDHSEIAHTRFSALYPYHPVLYKIYGFSISTLVFWLWAWAEVKKRKDKLKILTSAFNGGQWSSEPSFLVE